MGIDIDAKSFGVRTPGAGVDSSPARSANQTAERKTMIASNYESPIARQARLLDLLSCRQTPRLGR
jgi:hypothetical protein